jgi:copper resistance protein B
MRRLLFLLPLLGGLAQAQEMTGMSMGPEMGMGDEIYAHALLDQFEGRLGGQLRWDGQGWIGGDYDKLWIKSEGLEQGGRVEDGRHELLYDRAASAFFDLQAGLRADLDGGAAREWAAFGVQGLAPYFLDIEATAYVGDAGRTAARLSVSYDLLLTQRLILQPEAELDLYGQSDPSRHLGAGLSDLDAGVRLRYEISRKIAPYLGVSYRGAFGGTADYARREGESPSDIRFVIGLRAWY